jgi:protein-tyrosine phosphatase
VIDLHCHLLNSPERDPDAFAKTTRICRLAIEDGVRTIVATPRWDAEMNEPPLGFNECRRELERLRYEMREALSFKLGFLLRFRQDLPELLEQYGSSISLGGGRYVFVSVPSLNVSIEAEEVWQRVFRQGFSILLARAECSPALRRDPKRLERWIASGIMLQLDAASLTGMHGHEIQHFALQCVKKYEGSIVIASGVGSANARPSSLASAREQLLKKNDSRRVRRLMTETPAAMLDDYQNPSGNNASRSFRPTLISRLRSLRSHKVLPDES